MNDEHFHDIVMIRLMRRLDLGEAKREAWREYQDLCENEEILDMSNDALTMHMLDVLDKYELPHLIRREKNFKFLLNAPF